MSEQFDFTIFQAGISVFFSAIPVGLMIVGWKVLYGNAQRIATRSETFSIVNDLINQLNEARESCISTWCQIQQEDFNAELEWQKLKPYITSVRSSKAFLEKNRDIDVDNKRLVNFRRALSLKMNSYSAEGFEQARIDSITNIHKATQEFKEDLLSKFEKNYPAKF